MLAGQTLLSALADAIDHVRIVDVGAREYGPGSPPYAPLLSEPRTTVVGFDVDVRSGSAAAKARTVQIPRLLADGQRRRFYRCAAPMTSSLFRPNTGFLERFEDLGALCRIVSEEWVQTVRLDDVPGIECVDYLKIDVQGATMLVLQGAKKTLQDVLVVHTEVEFASIYEDAPQFGEVDTELRSRGFQFHHFVDFGCCRMRSNGSAFGRKATRQLWCDAVYFPSFARIESMEPKSLLKLAAIAHDCYGVEDFSSACLDKADAMTTTAFGPAYRSAMRPNSSD